MFYSKDFVKCYRWGLFLAVLYVQVDKSCSQISIKSQPPAPKVGQTVTLVIEYEGKIHMVNWYSGDQVVTSQNILTYNPESPSGLTTGPQFNNRMKALANGSLQISNVTASDSGDYTLQLTIPNSVAYSTFPLTVNPETETPSNVHPGIQPNFTTLTPTTKSPPHLHPTDGLSKGGKNFALIGIIIGSVAAVILIVVASVLWYRRGCNKSRQSQTPVYKDDKPTAVSSPSEDISAKLQNNFNRRLPSIPPCSTVYQNENSNNNIIKEDAEHSYTDLTYIYLSGSYHDLQSP